MGTLLSEVFRPLSERTGYVQREARRLIQESPVLIPALKSSEVHQVVSRLCFKDPTKSEYGSSSWLSHGTFPRNADAISQSAMAASSWPGSFAIVGSQKSTHLFVYPSFYSDGNLWCFKKHQYHSITIGRGCVWCVLFCCAVVHCALWSGVRCEKCCCVLRRGTFGFVNMLKLRCGAVKRSVALRCLQCLWGFGKVDFAI